MFQCVGTVELHEMRETKAPEDIEAPALVCHVIQLGMKAVAERVGLQELCCGRGMEQETAASVSHILTKHLFGNCV